MKVLLFLAVTTAALYYANAGSCVRGDWDYWGNDIKRVNADNVRSCIGKCLAHPKCKSIAFRGKNCWLKHKTNGKISRKTKGVTSANMSCARCATLRDNWDYWGADIKGQNFKVKGGVNACIARCKAHKGCKSLAFRPRDGHCWLKHKENGAKSRKQTGIQSINMSC